MSCAKKGWVYVCTGVGWSGKYRQVVKSLEGGSFGVGEGLEWRGFIHDLSRKFGTVCTLECNCL